MDNAILELCDSCDFFASDVVSTVINESSRTALECVLRSWKTLFSPQTHLGTYINLYSSERSIKWSFPLNARYAKNVIRNEAIYHFRVNSYIVPHIGRNKIYSFPIQPCHVFKIISLCQNHFLIVPRAVIKGGFSSSYCRKGYLLCHENDHNMFTNDWPVFLIPWLWHQVIKSEYNDPSKSNCWKLFWDTLTIYVGSVKGFISEQLLWAFHKFYVKIWCFRIDFPVKHQAKFHLMTYRNFRYTWEILFSTWMGIHSFDKLLWSLAKGQTRGKSQKSPAALIQSTFVSIQMVVITKKELKGPHKLWLVRYWLSLSLSEC